MDQLFFWIYNLPVVLMGFVWLAIEVKRRTTLTVPCVLCDLIVIGVGLGRFLGWQIPPSGHALFFSYSLLAVPNIAYRFFAAAFLLMTIALKLSWGDYSTWVYGIVVGVGLGLLHRFFATDRAGNAVAK